MIASIRRFENQCPHDEEPLGEHQYLSWVVERGDQTLAQSLRDIHRAFEDWTSAAQAAQVPATVTNQAHYSIEEVEHSFERVKKLLGDTRNQSGHAPGLSADHYRRLSAEHPELGLVPIYAIRRYFTWSEACREFGLAPAKVRAVNDISDLNERVYEICVAAGGEEVPLSVRQFDRVRPAGFPTAQRIARAQDCGWSEVLIRSGFTTTEVAAAQRARVHHTGPVAL